jgi:chromosome segregation ATPase
MTTNLWVDLGNGFVSSSSNNSEARGVQTFLKDFWVIARKKVISKELEVEEKKAKQLAKDLEKLADKKKDNEAEIEKCKKKISELENSNVTNLKDQDAKKAEIELQKRNIQAVIDRLNAVGKSI